MQIEHQFLHFYRLILCSTKDLFLPVFRNRKIRSCFECGIFSFKKFYLTYSVCQSKNKHSVSFHFNIYFLDFFYLQLDSDINCMSMTLLIPIIIRTEIEKQNI